MEMFNILTFDKYGKCILLFEFRIPVVLYYLSNCQHAVYIQRTQLTGDAGGWSNHPLKTVGAGVWGGGGVGGGQFSIINVIVRRQHQY